MKITSYSADSFAKNPDKRFCATLVYGPDTGVKLERANLIAKAIVDDITDPFRIIDLSVSQLSDDPSLLSDSFFEIPMMGGRRLIRLIDATDKITSLIDHFFNSLTSLSSPPSGSFILVTAGDLGPKSTLRKLFETSDFGAALACYHDEGSALEQLIKTQLKQYNLSLNQEALSFLKENLSGENVSSDRGITRSEIEKIALYHHDPKPSLPLTSKNIIECYSDNLGFSLDSLVYAVGDNNLSNLDQIFYKCLSDGHNPITILRSINRHFLRILTVKISLINTPNLDKALLLLKPPVFFKMKERFCKQVNAWSFDHIISIFSYLIDAEKECKKTGFPMDALCQQTLYKIARIK
ncbi:MAG: DNA polymerase III subunit delta [Alphaproteobacteria bacterium]|nr:DNA polymerase III subunit delta [Alphaproteobacteria bacterium]